MKTRHLGKALVGLVAAAAAVGLMGLPASADTATGEITSGTLNIFASDSSEYSEQDLGTGGSVECTAGTGSITVTSTGAFSGTFVSNTYTNIGGTNFTVQMTITLTGTVSTTGSLTGTGSATADLYNGNCGGTKVCTIAVGSISINGTTTVGTDHNIDVSDTATVSGTTGDHGAFTFNVSVTGTNCGGLIGVDDGSVTSTNVVVHATS